MCTDMTMSRGRMYQLLCRSCSALHPHTHLIATTLADSSCPWAALGKMASKVSEPTLGPCRKAMYSFQRGPEATSWAV